MDLNAYKIYKKISKISFDMRIVSNELKYMYLQ